MRTQPIFPKQANLPSELKTWLYAAGSLTQQLTQLAGGQFKVEPLQQSFQRLNLQDAQWMQMPHWHTSWCVKAIYMAVMNSHGSKPKVFFRF